MSTPRRPALLAEAFAGDWREHPALVVDQLLEIALAEGGWMLATVAVRLTVVLGKEEARRLVDLIEARMS